MTKPSSLILAAALALTACGSDDDTILAPTKLAFSVADNATGMHDIYATVCSTRGLVAENETFTYSPATNAFESAIEHPWASTDSLDIYALSVPGDMSYDPYGTPSVTYPSWDGSQDLLAAYAVNARRLCPYPLTFHHITSQIQVRVQIDPAPREYSYRIKSIRLTAPASGTFSFADREWHAARPHACTYSYLTDSHSLTPQGEATVWQPEQVFNLLPVAQGELTFEVEYQLLRDGMVLADHTGPGTHIAHFSTPNLEQGRQYSYTFSLPTPHDDLQPIVVHYPEMEGRGK